MFQNDAVATFIFLPSKPLHPHLIFLIHFYLRGESLSKVSLLLHYFLLPTHHLSFSTLGPPSLLFPLSGTPPLSSALTEIHPSVSSRYKCTSALMSSDYASMSPLAPCCSIFLMFLFPHLVVSRMDELLIHIFCSSIS